MIATQEKYEECPHSHLVAPLEIVALSFSLYPSSNLSSVSILTFAKLQNVSETA